MNRWIETDEMDQIVVEEVKSEDVSRSVNSDVRLMWGMF
jgi:hypothetical protein